MARVTIIPMAGLGTRFADVGYTLPKPLIPVSGKPMITRVIESLPTADRWIFIVRPEHVRTFAVDAIIRATLPNAEIIEDPNPQGQAATCMLGIARCSPDDEVLIAACDNGFVYNAEQFDALRAQNDIDAIIWTFTNDPLLTIKPEAWGWIKLAPDGLTIDDMSVKVPVSNNPLNDHAVVATFWFRHARDFTAAYNAMHEANHRINGEFYVDAMPIFLKQLGKRSVIFDVDLYVGWGKPADLYVYQEKEHRYHINTLTDERWRKFFIKTHDETPR